MTVKRDHDTESTGTEPIGADDPGTERIESASAETAAIVHRPGRVLAALAGG